MALATEYNYCRHVRFSLLSLWVRLSVSGQTVEDHECQARELELGCGPARLFEQKNCHSESGLVI